MSPLAVPAQDPMESPFPSVGGEDSLIFTENRKGKSCFSSLPEVGWGYEALFHCSGSGTPQPTKSQNYSHNVTSDGKNKQTETRKTWF